MKFDLHIHSSFSDGSDSVEAIIAKAKQQKLSGIAITDHDNLKGASLASKLAKQAGIMFSPSVEFSSKAKEEVHILGYGLDYNSPRLQELTAYLIKKREQRFYKIIEKLNNMGAKITPPKIAEGESAGRVLAAKLLVQSGKVFSIGEAFDKYLANGKAAYVEAEKLTPLQTIKEIKGAGGTAVIAHPSKLYRAGYLIKLIDGLKPYGLDGIEAYYPQHSRADTAQFEHIAKLYGLITTGGSDYHGSNGIAEMGCVNYELSAKAQDMIFKNC